jgi:HAE1 family hydrophobic/amphiphilic exporter-1
VPVFDGLRTSGKVAQAKADRNIVAQTKVALENQIRLEARDAVDRLSVAKKVLDTTELNLRQAKKALEMIQANYKFGAATLLDVIDAQAAQTLADSNRVQALYIHANARATLRFVMAQDPLDPPVGALATPPAPNPDPPAASPETGTRP